MSSFYECYMRYLKRNPITKQDLIIVKNFLKNIDESDLDKEIREMYDIYNKKHHLNLSKIEGGEEK